MKIERVVCSVGRSGYMHRDLAAMKGGAQQDGFVFHGKPVSPGFRRIAEPATIISVMLFLSDGQIAFGDCADVILAGVAGRDPAFQADEHIDYLRGELAATLTGRDVSKFRAHAEELDRYQRNGKPLHTAVRYGITQALLHAAALASKTTMAEVIAKEYGSKIATAPIPILASCHKDDPLQLDRVILKRVELLPHASFTLVPQHVGLKGEKLVDFARMVSTRIRQIGDADYRPRIHLDVYGTLGELFEMRLEPLADYLGRVREAAAPFELLVESPIIAKTQQQQIESFRTVRALLKRKGVAVGLIADEWCNTLEDIKLFADEAAADYVQIKTPDLGGINNTIEAVLYCKSHGMGAGLGGTANETDQSARITTHIALACQPDFQLSKPGLGADEAIMIQTNEMARTLAILEARK
ncbi:MAG TPA: methylaspartate ammonia-lyase [Stellaceae bacterium]|nr:methylaspartate ammonia-lyase [Stellaceae bacterium]